MTIANLPHLQDVTTTIELLGTLGVTVSLDEKRRLEVNTSTLKSLTAPYELVENHARLYFGIGSHAGPLW